MWWIIPASILWFTGVLFWDVRSDYRKHLEGDPIDHDSKEGFKELLIRSLLLVPATFGLVVGHFSIFNIPIAIFMVMAWYWEFFDGWLNSLKGKPWRYNGSDDDNGDADTDDFLFKYTPAQQALIKIGLIVLSTAAYIIAPYIFNI